MPRHDYHRDSACHYDRRPHYRIDPCTFNDTGGAELILEIASTLPGLALVLFCVGAFVLLVTPIPGFIIVGLALIVAVIAAVQHIQANSKKPVAASQSAVPPATPSDLTEPVQKSFTPAKDAAPSSSPSTDRPASPTRLSVATTLIACT